MIKRLVYSSLVIFLLWSNLMVDLQALLRPGGLHRRSGSYGAQAEGQAARRPAAPVAAASTKENTEEKRAPIDRKNPTRTVLMILDSLLEEQSSCREMMALLTQTLWERKTPIFISAHLLKGLLEIRKHLAPIADRLFRLALDHHNPEAFIAGLNLKPFRDEIFDRLFPGTIAAVVPNKDYPDRVPPTLLEKILGLEKDPWDKYKEDQNNIECSKKFKDHSPEKVRMLAQIERHLAQNLYHVGWLGNIHEHWLVYRHTDADYLLLFPKSGSSTGDADVRKYGFNVGAGTSFFAVSDVYVMPKADYEFHPNIRNIFWPTYGIVEELMRNTMNWIVVLAGHGEAPKKRERCDYDQDHESNVIKSLELDLVDYMHAKSDIKSDIKKSELLRERLTSYLKQRKEDFEASWHKEKNGDIKPLDVPFSGKIAGLTARDFENLLKSFSRIGISVLTYYSCYPVRNRAFVQDVLKHVTKPFIICSMGSFEMPVRGLLLSDFKMRMKAGRIEPVFPYSIQTALMTMSKSLKTIKNIRTLTVSDAYRLCPVMLKDAVYRPLFFNNHQPYVYVPAAKKFIKIEMQALSARTLAIGLGLLFLL